MENIDVTLLFGSVELETRQVPVSNGVAWESRRKSFDIDGKLTEVTPWVETGVRLLWPEQQGRPWWKFWGL